MKTDLRQLILPSIASTSVLLILAGVSIVFEINTHLMTRDISAIAKIHPLSGILSSLGILLWCVAVSVCFFVARILRNCNQSVKIRFLNYSGLLTLYLLLDDLFLFHEKLASQYLGLNEKIVFAVLGISVLSYLLAFRQVILKTKYYILFLAYCFLGFSVFIDSIPQVWLWRLNHWVYFFEDGAKWFGIVFWCNYYVITAYQFLVKELNQQNATDGREQAASQAAETS